MPTSLLSLGYRFQGKGIFSFNYFCHILLFYRNNVCGYSQFPNYNLPIWAIAVTYLSLLVCLEHGVLLVCLSSKATCFSFILCCCIWFYRSNILLGVGLTFDIYSYSFSFVFMQVWRIAAVHTELSVLLRSCSLEKFMTARYMFAFVLWSCKYLCTNANFLPLRKNYLFLGSVTLKSVFWEYFLNVFKISYLCSLEVECLILILPFSVSSAILFLEFIVIAVYVFGDSSHVYQMVQNIMSVCLSKCLWFSRVVKYLNTYLNSG